MAVGSIISNNDVLLDHSTKLLLDATSQSYNSKLQQLEKAGKRGSEEWYSTKLDQIKNKVRADEYNDRKFTTPLPEVEEIINELASQRSKLSDTKKLQTLDSLIGEYSSYAADLMTYEIGKNENKFEITVKSPARTVPGYMGISGYQTSDSAILEIDSNGKITGFYSNGERHDINELLDQTYSGTYINNLLRNNNNLEDLESSSRIETITGSDQLDSYKSELATINKYYDSAQKAGFLSSDQRKLKEVDLKITTGDYKGALNDIENLKSSTKEISSQAYQREATAYLKMNGDMSDSARQSDSGKELMNNRIESAYSALQQAVKQDPNNNQAKQTRDVFVSSQLSTAESLAGSEYKRIAIDLREISNDLGSDSNWQTAIDSLSAVGEPWTVVHKWWYSDEYIAQAGSEVLKAHKIGDAARQMNKLVLNRVNLNDYQGKDFWGKFTDVYQANGLDDLVSVDVLKKHLSSNYLRNAGQDNTKRVERLMEVLVKEESINENSFEFQNRFLSSLKYMGDIDYGLKESESLGSLLKGDNFVALPDRIGDKVEISDGTSAALFAADIALNPLNLVGAGFAARASSSVAKLTLTTGLKTTLNAWKSIGLKQFAKSYATEIAIDGTISVSMVGLAEVSPELAKTAGLALGIVAASSFAKSSIDDVSSAIKTGKLQGTNVYGDISSGNLFVTGKTDLDKVKGAYSTDEIISATSDNLIVSINGKETKFGINTNAAQELVDVQSMKVLMDNALGETGQTNLNAEIALGKAKAKRTSSIPDNSDINKAIDDWIASGSKIPDDEKYAARSFIDKDHYFLAANRGRSSSGAESSSLMDNPGTSYGDIDWTQWKAARKYVEDAAKTGNGQVSEELIKEVGKRIPSQTIHPSIAVTPSVNYRTFDSVPGADYQVGKVSYYNEKDFLGYKNNPYLDVDGIKISDDPYFYRILKDKYPDESSYFQSNADKYYAGFIFYPRSTEVPFLMKELVTNYNPKIQKAKTVDEIINVAADFQRDYVSIHPFRDGNGRTSRLMMDYILMSKGLPSSQLDNTNLDLGMRPAQWRTEVKKGVYNAIKNSEGKVTN
jgi:hypothetical protein